MVAAPKPGAGAASVQVVVPFAVEHVLEFGASEKAVVIGVDATVTVTLAPSVELEMYFGMRRTELAVRAGNVKTRVTEALLALLDVDAGGKAAGECDPPPPHEASSAEPSTQTNAAACRRRIGRMAYGTTTRADSPHCSDP
jgi:hypothetical protein